MDAHAASLAVMRLHACAGGRWEEGGVGVGDLSVPSPVYPDSPRACPGLPPYI